MNGFSNQPQPKWPEEQSKIGTGEGESPLASPSPPQPKVEVRTMESDLRSLQETGGQTVKPYSPQPPAQEPVFQPPQVETPQPPTPPPPTARPPAEFPTITPTLPEKKKGKKWVTALVIVLVVIAAAAAGYFFVYPALFPAAPEEITPPPPTPPPPPAEEPPVVPPPPEPSTLNLPTIQTYVSFFKTPADTIQDITLTTATLNAFRQLIPFETSPTASFKEIVVKNQNGQVIAFSGLMPLLVPNFFDTNTLNYFEDNYTLFAYTNEQGTWLGYVAKFRDGVDVGAIQTRISVLQQDADNKNLFLAEPGPTGVWRDGTMKDRAASLVDFSQTGATLGYAWFENYLLISTNLSGATEAATRLGF